MVRIDITKHAYDRMKDRLGLSKKAATRMAEIAYAEGIKHGDTNGRLYKYIAAQAYAYMKKGYCLKIYGEAVYCFINGKTKRQMRRRHRLLQYTDLGIITDFRAFLSCKDILFDSVKSSC